MIFHRALQTRDPFGQVRFHFPHQDRPLGLLGREYAAIVTFFEHPGAHAGVDYRGKMRGLIQIGLIQFGLILLFGSSQQYLDFVGNAQSVAAREAPPFARLGFVVGMI